MSQMSNEGRDAVRAVHHQIGNSLQSVASLLNLESRSAPPEAATVLSEAGRRVSAVMRLHQRLQETDGDFVRLDDLLADICRDIAELDAVDRDAEIRVDLQPYCATPKIAAAMAMITAELVGNSLEHGLARRAGTVEVRLAPTDDGTCLVVQDDGEGIPDGRLRPGFGLTLVTRLARQLGAKVEKSSGPAGTCFEMICPGLWLDPTGSARPTEAPARVSTRSSFSTQNRRIDDPS